MLQNIKVDIIYYLTQTDFEMEFNLCGCCRMRLLTDKASDRKEFIHMLSRAVSRSRVTITCGKVEGDTGLIRSIAAAIGKKVIKVNNDAYGIRGSKECFVIEGAMPLVSPDGVFGGCIIESGPQAIVILTENRSVRKSIMNTLIHPYIEEVSINDAKSTLSETIERATEDESAEQTEETAAEPESVMPTTEELTAQAASIAAAAASQAVNAIKEAVAQGDESAEEPESSDEDSKPQEDAAQEPAAAQFQKLYEESKEDSQDAEPIEDEQEPQVQDEDIAETQLHTEEESVVEKESAVEEETAQESEKDTFDINSLLSAQENANDFSFAGEIEKNEISDDSTDDENIDYDEDSDDEYLNDIYYEESDDGDYKDSKFRLPIMILAVISIIMILILAYILLFVPFSKGYNFNEYIRELFAISKVGIKWF